MIKFNVKGDNSANPFYSSSLIINGLNEGAKKLGLYDEKGKTVVYSTTCNDYGNHTDAFLCVYEASLPVPVLQSANSRPIIGCSLHNLFFITDVYPNQFSAYCQLGVDADKFKPLNLKKDTFRFLAFCESNVRSGLQSVLAAYAQLPKNDNVELYIKDRGATDKLKDYIKNIRGTNRIIHDTENTQKFEDILNLYNSANFLLFPSYCTTWGMPFLESMACGIPVITTSYAGPAEYCRDSFNSLIVDHKMVDMNQNMVDEFVNFFGYRHHMFPVGAHSTKPYWSMPETDDLRRVMFKAIYDCPEYPYLCKNARITAEQFTWERAASTLSMSLYKIFNK